MYELRLFPGRKKELPIKGLETLRLNLSNRTRIDYLQEERDAAISLANKMLDSVKFQATQVSRAKMEMF
jgi:hypothetical protein